MAKYESQAAKLIREEVIPRLDAQDAVQVVHGKKLDRVEGILIATGLDNGTGEKAQQVLKSAIDHGLDIAHRRELARAFFGAYLGWLTPSWRTATKWALGFFGGFSTVYWGIKAIQSAPGMVNEASRHLHR